MILFLLDYWLNLNVVLFNEELNYDLIFIPKNWWVVVFSVQHLMPEKVKVEDCLEHKTSLILRKGCESLNDPAVQNLKFKAWHEA